ncbi:MAG: hypothetical protein Roseis2KO_33880 [Roseivirga sp.]
MEKKDWKILIEELRKGNNHVLGVFYKQHASYCLKRLSRENKCSPEDAEDIFTEAIMNLREKLISGRETIILNVRAYLYKTCYNTLLVKLRQDARAQQKLGDLERFYYDSIYMVDDQSFEKELLKATMEAWMLLSERCRDILYFFYVDKQSMKEITGLMGLNNANVTKTTKARCYKKWTELAWQTLTTLKKGGAGEVD